MNRKIIDAEVDKVELNSMLNKLQNINLQLDLDQLIEFMKDKVVPSYFTNYLTKEKELICFGVVNLKILLNFIWLILMNLLMMIS